MELHAERKIATRKALRKAHGDGETYEAIAASTGVPASSVRQFAINGKLGKDRVLAVADWLAEHGYLAANTQEGATATMIPAAKSDGDPLLEAEKAVEYWLTVIRNPVRDSASKARLFLHLLELFHSEVGPELAEMSKHGRG